MKVSIQMKRTQIGIGPFVSVVSHSLLPLQSMTIDLFSSAVHSYWSLLNYDECLPSKEVKFKQAAPRSFNFSHLLWICIVCKMAVGFIIPYIWCWWGGQWFFCFSHIYILEMLKQPFFLKQFISTFFEDLHIFEAMSVSLVIVLLVFCLSSYSLL